MFNILNKFILLLVIPIALRRGECTEEYREFAKEPFPKGSLKLPGQRCCDLLPPDQSQLTIWEAVSRKWGKVGAESNESDYYINNSEENIPFDTVKQYLLDGDRGERSSLMDGFSNGCGGVCANQTFAEACASQEAAKWGKSSKKPLESFPNKRSSGGGLKGSLVLLCLGTLLQVL